MKTSGKTKKYTFIPFIKIGLLLFAVSLMSTKCGKNNPPPDPPEPTLPEATQNGANTFGCKVNGQVYLPKGNLYLHAIDQPKYYTGSGAVWVRTRNLNFFDNGDGIYIYIYIKSDAYQTGIYSGFEDSTYSCVRVYPNDMAGHYDYNLDSTQSHFIELTKLDTNNRIISGIFEFTCLNEVLQDTFEITEGRFDLNNVIINP